MNNSAAANKIYDFFQDITPHEWALVEFKESLSGAIVNRLGTSFMDGHEYVIHSYSLKQELDIDKLSKNPLEYWKHSHSHPTGHKIPSTDDLNLQKRILGIYPNAKFDIR